MKKAFVTLMAIFLLINSVGFTIYAHYCNDELKGTSVITKAESCCEEEATTPVKESKEEMSCCAEKDVHIVLKDHFIKSEISFNAISHPLLFISQNFVFECFKNNSQFTIHNSQFIIGDSRPPTDLNLINSVFRI